MSSLVECRYNPNHKVKNSRLLSHELNCPNKNTKSVVVCSFDPSHKVKVGDLEKHERTCPRRPNEDLEVMKEMEKYIQDQANLIRSQNRVQLNNISNSIDSTNKTAKKTFTNEETKSKNDNVVGLRNNKEKQKIIEEEKDFKKLQESVDDEDHISNLNYIDNEIDINKDDTVFEEEKNINNKIKENKLFNLENQEYNPNESNFYERNKIQEISSSESEDEVEKISFQGDISLNNESNSKSLKEYDLFDSNLVTNFEKSREGGR